MAEKFSKRLTATSTATALDSTTEVCLSIGVKIDVKSTEANGVEVMHLDATSGTIIEPGKSAWFICNSLGQIKVKADGPDVDFGYYAY